MKIKSRYFLILCITFKSLFSYGIKFSHLTIENGLSQTSVKCIFQDSRGFLWIGTADGLNKYDGYEFKIYRNNPSSRNSLKSNDITCVFEDTKSRSLWIGTQNDGINIYSRDKDLFYRFGHDNKNNLSLSGNSIREINTDINQNLWIATLDGSMCRFEPKDSTFIRPGFTAKNYLKRINCFKIDETGCFWIGTANGLFKWDKDAQENDLEPVRVEFAKALSVQNITAIEIDLKRHL